jgi:hypothetical protein
LGLHPDESPIARSAEVFELMRHAKDYGLAARPDKPVGAGDYTADHIVIATGARPRILLGLESPKRMPQSLLVIGSGAIAIEFGSFYSGLGSKVTVVEVLPRILPAEEEEIARFARTQLEKQGIAIRTRATVTSAKRAPVGVHRSRRGEKAPRSSGLQPQPPTGPARRHRRPAAHRQENGALRAGRMAAERSSSARAGVALAVYGDESGRG